jgi:hypothetical protein
MRSWSRPWSRSRSWCGSRRYCGSRRRSRTYPNFERADIEATISYAKEIWAALVIKRRRGKTRIARVNGRAAIRQLMRRGVAAVILQRAEQRIGINDRRGRLLVNARLRRALFAQRLGRPPDRFAAANRPRAAECSRSPFFNPPEAGNYFLADATHQRGVGRGFATGRGRGMGVGLGP